MGWGECQSKVRPVEKPGPEILVLSTEFYKPVDKKSSNLYDFSLTFGLVTCKIDSVWCTLGQYGTKRFIDNRRFAGVCVITPDSGALSDYFPDLSGSFSYTNEY